MNFSLERRKVPPQDDECWDAISSHFKREMKAMTPPPPPPRDVVGGIYDVVKTAKTARHSMRCCRNVKKNDDEGYIRSVLQRQFSSRIDVVEVKAHEKYNFLKYTCDAIYRASK